MGICWEEFKNVDIIGILGSKENSKSFAYHFFNGEKVHNTTENLYGEELIPGDIISACVDMDKHTLSYSVNGKELGVAFAKVPLKGVWFAYNAFHLSTEVEIL